MGRQLLGYRGRGRTKDGFVYAGFVGAEFCWTRGPTLPQERQSAKFETERAQYSSIDTEGKMIEVSDVKIVAVYLKTNEYMSSFASERVREDLSDFNRAVLDEIDNRNIDAMVEPEMTKGQPTTIRFRATNNDFVWVPIIRYAVTDGLDGTRAMRTVDRMLQAIGNVAKSLSKDEARVAECEGNSRTNKIAMVGEGPCDTDMSKLLTMQQAQSLAQTLLDGMTASDIANMIGT